MSAEVAGLRRGRVRANGLAFEFLEAGHGPLALCLHGFPDSAETWNRVLPELAGAGYRAVAPWMRGYAPTDVPADGDYRGAALVADTIALHEALGGGEDAVLLGHDWGAFATYGAAAHAPERWRRAVAIAMPPLGAMVSAFRRLEHVRRAWHLFFFLTPLAEQAVVADDFSFLTALCEQWSPGFDAAETLARARRSLEAEGGLAAALGYYRAVFSGAPLSAERKAMQASLAQPTRTPTLYLYGDRDGLFAPEVAELVRPMLCEGSRRVMVERAGHFLHLERPDVAIEEIVSFVA